MVDILRHPNDRLGQVVTINVLPDDVLLAIFDFYVFKPNDLQILLMVFGGLEKRKQIESWQSLVHVCRRWRGLVFGSPRRLNLQLQVFYPPESPKRKPGRMTQTLDAWPALPLLINILGGVYETSVDNVIAELGHSDRMRIIDLHFGTTTSQIQVKKLWTAMQVPFPELEMLRLSIGGLSYLPNFPDPFLGGSAPRLRYLELKSIPIRGLPNLLMSATHLSLLYIHDIPHSGYFSPNAMATCLSMLTSLRRLRLDFESPQSSPDQENIHSPQAPPTRTILPALIWFSFKGVSGYLEELVAWIDTPRLKILSAIFFNDIDFDTLELTRFLSRSLTFKAPKEVHLFFDKNTASVKLLPQESNANYILVEISCKALDWQLSSLAQICATSSTLLSTTENLFIYDPVTLQLDWRDGIENTEWLELLLPFTALKNLYISKQFAQRIAPALQEIAEGGAAGVLLTLQNLYVEGFEPSETVQEGIEQFISARRLTSPVAISVWDRGLNWDTCCLRGYYDT